VKEDERHAAVNAVSAAPRIVVADAVGVADVGLHGHVSREVVRHEAAEPEFVEGDVAEHYGFRADRPLAELHAGSPAYPEVAIPGLELALDCERKLSGTRRRHAPQEDRPDAIPQRRVAGRSRVEVVLFVVRADEALGDEAVAEYLVADRAIAAEEVAVAVRGGACLLSGYIIAKAA